MSIFGGVFKSKKVSATEWANRSSILLLAKRYDDALKAIDKAIKINPDEAALWCNRGAILSSLDRNDDAMISYDKAIHLDAKNTLIWTSRGAALNKLDRYEEAVDSFNRAIKIASNNYVAWTQRGIALARLGRYVDARESYDKALDINPNYEDAQKNREKIIGQASIIEGKEEKKEDEREWIEDTDDHVFIEVEIAGCPGCLKADHQWKKTDDQQGKNGPVQFFICEKCKNKGILFSYKPDNDELKKWTNYAYFQKKNE